MPNLNIDAAIAACKKEYEMMVKAAKFSGNMDPERQKEHDHKHLKALNLIVKDISSYWDEFVGKVNTLKPSAKSAMDRIEVTLKSKGSKLQEGDWRVLERDQWLIKSHAEDLSADLKKMFSDLGDWRKGWESQILPCLFTDGAKSMIENMIKIRQRQIQQQSQEVTPEIERIRVYVARVEALFAVARKASTGSGLAELAKMRDAFVEVWSKDPKNGAAQRACKVKDALEDAKKMLKVGKATGPYSTAVQAQIDDPLSGGKTLRGAVKSLEILKTSTATMAKSASKAHASEWGKLTEDIKEALKTAEATVKYCEEYEKLAPKLVQLYKNFEPKKK